MSGNPEATASGQRDIAHSGLTREQEELEIQDLLFSEAVSSICY
jgi:hypothetical protein